MKTSITSNCKPLWRALHPFLIAVAVLWATPRNAEAQLYIPQSPPFSGALGIVSEYTSTGKVINANFISGLQNPTGFVLSDNTLFIAYLAGPSDIGTVGKYDASTGAVINAALIKGVTLLGARGNTLFARDGGHRVGEYDASTGKVINANFITGLKNEPVALALLNNRLFLAKFLSGTVGEYDATTGAVINANFITGLNFPVAIAIKSIE